MALLESLYVFSIKLHTDMTSSRSPDPLKVPRPLDPPIPLKLNLTAEKPCLVIESNTALTTLLFMSPPNFRGNLEGVCV